MPSPVKPVALGDLSSWPTRRLLALRDRLLRCEDTPDQSDVQDLAEIDPSVIRFKDDPRWTELYEATINVLNTREHVPTGTERKLRRKR